MLIWLVEKIELRCMLRGDRKKLDWKLCDMSSEKMKIVEDDNLGD